MNKPSKGIPYAWSWNPICMRCTPCSPGCANCWHLRMCDRMAANPVIPKWKRAIYAGKAPPRIDDDELTAPMWRKKPTTIALLFMGDWMHKDITNIQMVWVHCAMRIAPEHRYLTLTKREDRLLERFTKYGEPHPNWWLGLSVCTQEEYDQKWPQLAALKKAGWHTWLSIEPMLERIVLRGDILPEWVVAGPETGPRARSWHTLGVHLAVMADDCKLCRIPFYDKRDPADLGFTRRELPW